MGLITHTIVYDYVEDVDKNNCTFYGISVKLCDGCMISWDGAFLDHCTSIRKRSPNQYQLKHEKPSIGTFASFHIAHNGGTQKQKDTPINISCM